MGSHKISFYSSHIGAKTRGTSRGLASSEVVHPFCDPAFTVTGAPRAQVEFSGYKALWFNTGTICNLACRGCYIESSPRNDRLVYLSREEVRRYLDEASRLSNGTFEVGFTGGEPFMNPGIIGMLEDSLERGMAVVVLTNAMRPMQRYQAELEKLHARHGERIRFRVSLDYFERSGHEDVRGPRSWKPAMAGLHWLSDGGFSVSVAARALWGQREGDVRIGFALLFAREGLKIDADDPAQLVLFPEMDENAQATEISQSCWTKLDRSPSDLMCANSRMIIKRRGAEHPVVVACTLLPYSEAFELGATLTEAMKSVHLNHPHCSQFCILGGASCSTGGVNEHA